MKLSIKAGATSQSVLVFVQNNSVTTGVGLTGLVYNTSGLTAYYSFAGAATTSTAITLATLASVTSAWSSGGFKEVDSTNMPGVYRLDIPNAVLASGNGRSVVVYLQGAANMAPLPIEVELTGWDNQDAVHGGLSALPNTACTTNASLLTSGTGTDQLSVSSGQVNLGKILGTVVSSPATAGILDVNVKNMNNVAATSITTINANQGTTQPLNFTGTAGSALVKGDTVDIAGSAVSATTAQLGVNVVNWNNTVVATPATAGIPDINVKNIANTAATVDGNNYLKVDVVDIAGAAVSASTAQLGVNVVNIAGTVSAGAAGYMAPDWSAIHAPTSTQNLSGTTISTSQAVASVSGSVGSVTGIVSANTTELAGQTVTAASGVTFPSSVASPTNITAGTITTVTNLTNAPTNGDFTTTMKTSLNNATPASVIGAVGSVTGNVGGSVASVTNVVSANVTEINGNSTSAGNLQRSTLAIATGTAGSGSTTTSINTSSLSPATTAANQFLGRIVIFDSGTTTTALRGQATSITASNTSGNLTVTALSNAPVAGDTFTIT